MNVYEKRWKKVSEYANRLKKILEENPNYYFELVGFDILSANEVKIIIDEDKKYFDISKKCSPWTQIMYDGNLEYDMGAYTPIKETLKSFDEQIILYERKQIKI